MPLKMTLATTTRAPQDLAPEVIDALTRLASGIRFGSIEVVVHEGRITQIERREKLRIAHETAPARG